MNANILVVGPAGAGKTTLIERAYPDHHHVDVLDYLGPPFPSVDDRGAFLDSYRDMAADLFPRGEAATLTPRERVAVEVCPDWPTLTLPRVGEALRQRPRRCEVVVLTADLRTCLRRNRSRDRQAPEDLIKRHHNVDLHRTAEWIATAVGRG